MSATGVTAAGVASTSSASSTASCRLQELLRRPIFPSLSLLPPPAQFSSTSNDARSTANILNPHLSQILANSEHRLNLAQQRIQQLHNQQQQQQQQHQQQQHPQHPHPHPHQNQSSSLNCQLQQPKRRYSCTQCPYSTDRRDLFRRHENIHRDEKPFRCYVCNKMFNRADHVKKHFLRIHKGLDYDVKLTKRIKGVDYDIKDNFDRGLTSNGQQMTLNNGSPNELDINGNGNISGNLNLNHIPHSGNSNCNGNGSGNGNGNGSSIFNRTVNVSVNINGSKDDYATLNGNKSHCFTLFPPHPYLFSNGIHIPSMAPTITQIKEELGFRGESNSHPLFGNIKPASEITLFPPSSNGHCSNGTAGNNGIGNGNANSYGNSLGDKLSDDSEEDSEDEDETCTEYECEYCGCAFANYASLHTHRYLLHRYMGDKDATSLYRCVLCDHKCITQRAMIKHMENHSVGGLRSSDVDSVFRSRLRLESVDSVYEVNDNHRRHHQVTNCSSSLPVSRRKQSQPKKVIKTEMCTDDDRDEDLITEDRCDKICSNSKFNCKICHKQYATYTQLIQHQMFFKHFH